MTRRLLLNSKAVAYLPELQSPTPRGIVSLKDQICDVLNLVGLSGYNNRNTLQFKGCLFCLRLLSS